MRENLDMDLRTRATGVVRHIAVSQAGTDIFATAEFGERVTLWSFRSKKKLAEIKTVLDYGGKRLAVVQEQGFFLLSAANFYGPLNAYDLEGNVVWSRTDLVGVQELTAIPNGSEPMIGVGSDGRPYKILSALDGKEITELNGIKEVYASSMMAQILAITSGRSLCLVRLGSAPIWNRPLRSFGVLHGCLSSKEVVYSEVGGAMYCVDLHGTHKWMLSPEKDRHFLRVAWNQTSGRWAAVDWNYAHGGAKRLLEVTEMGASRVITNLGEPAETEFFATGDRLVTSDGVIRDAHSGQIIWTFLEK